MKRTLGIAGIIWFAVGACLAAQSASRPASPAGTSATQIGGANGKWMEISYGRPIKRGRDLWGSGAEYGKLLNDGAPVWRAGANLTTKLTNEMPIVINGKTLAPGAYSLLIDIKPSAWTLIVTTQTAQTRYDANNKTDLYGSFNYTPDKDVVRAPMTLATLPISIDQLTWNIADVTDAGGKLAIMWDKVLATAPFTVAK
jgi:hypothetical protein